MAARRPPLNPLANIFSPPPASSSARTVLKSPDFRNENSSPRLQDVAIGGPGLVRARNHGSSMRNIGSPNVKAGGLDNTESIDRSLAFAVRERASGSGLPRVVAELKQMLDVAKDNDAETAELFAKLVSRKIHLDRRLQKQIDRFMYREPEVQHWSAGMASDDKNVNPDMTEEQRLLGPWLEHMAAYQTYRGKSLESTSNQGLAPVTARTSASARPLRDKLLIYLGEAAMYKESCHFGIRFRKPRPIHLHGENTPVEGAFKKPRRLHSLRDLSTDLSRKLLPQKKSRRGRRGPPKSLALREALEDIAMM